MVHKSVLRNCLLSAIKRMDSIASGSTRREHAKSLLSQKGTNNEKGPFVPFRDEPSYCSVPSGATQRYSSRRLQRQTAISITLSTRSKIKSAVPLSLLATLLCAVSCSCILGATPEFNYQGKLTVAGKPANGNDDMQLKLFRCDVLRRVAISTWMGDFHSKLYSMLKKANRSIKAQARFRQNIIPRGAARDAGETHEPRKKLPQPMYLHSYLGVGFLLKDKYTGIVYLWTDEGKTSLHCFRP